MEIVNFIIISLGLLNRVSNINFNILLNASSLLSRISSYAIITSYILELNNRSKLKILELYYY